MMTVKKIWLVAFVAFGVSSISTANAAPPKPPSGAKPPQPTTPFVTTPKTRAEVATLKRSAVRAQSAKVKKAKAYMNSLAQTTTQVSRRNGINYALMPKESGVLRGAINQHGLQVAQLKQLTSTSLRDFASARNMRIVRRRPVQQSSQGPSGSPPPGGAGPIKSSKSWRPPGSESPRVAVRKVRFKGE